MVIVRSEPLAIFDLGYRRAVRLGAWAARCAVGLATERRHAPLALCGQCSDQLGDRGARGGGRVASDRALARILPELDERTHARGVAARIRSRAALRRPCALGCAACMCALLVSTAR